MNTICIAENYGPISKGSRVQVVGEGYDYFMVRHRGKLIYVPKNFEGEPDPEPEVEEYEEEEQNSW
jgi:hypothetical protein